LTKIDKSKIDPSPSLDRRQLLRDLSIAALATQVTQAAFARSPLVQTPDVEAVAVAKFADVLKQVGGSSEPTSSSGLSSPGTVSLAAPDSGSRSHS